MERVGAERGGGSSPLGAGNRGEALLALAPLGSPTRRCRPGIARLRLRAGSSQVQRALGLSLIHI
eukprot:10919024-Alexandrium_andersonii.AAC.1